MSQVLNFGLSAPIDIQIENGNYDTSYKYATLLKNAMRTIPGTADLNIKQILNYPTFMFHVDRERAQEMGLQQKDVANSLLVALSSNNVVAPSFYINPANNINYNVAIKVPYQELNTLNSVLNTAVTPSAPTNSTTSLADMPMSETQTLGNLATVDFENQYDIISHYSVQRIMDVTANVDGRDLGSVTDDIEKKITAMGQLPKGMHIHLRGQPEVMKSTFTT